MTTPHDSQSSQGDPQRNYSGAPITLPYHIEERFIREIDDESKDKENKREIERKDADAHRDYKGWLVRFTIGLAILVSLAGFYITFNHKDAKVRELGVSLISAPIVGLFGILAGMAFK